MNWAKQQLANVAGTQEPVYGPSAIQSVSKQTPSFTVLQPADLKWSAPTSTAVETQTFYITAKNGHQAMAQVIYSNVAGIHTTCQFNSKIFYPAVAEGGKRSKPNLWCSNALNKHKLDNDRQDFKADKLSVSLDKDGKSFHIKSSTAAECVVDVTFTQETDGFVAGRDGTSTFGTNPQEPWGSMWHKFWPRCKVTGTFITRDDGAIDMDGTGTFVHALQGMKPHHAASTWNFCNWHGPEHSAILMQFTTPKSYGSTTVSVGGVTAGSKLVFAGSSGTSAEHTAIKGDSQVDWPEPKAVSFKWEGTGVDGQPVAVELPLTLGERVDRVDVMAEVPKFVKQIVAGAAGTRPYIYQVRAALVAPGGGPRRVRLLIIHSISRKPP